MVKSLNVLMALLAGVEALRKRREHEDSGSTSKKTIGGVPVLNYELAYGGGASAMAESDVDWIVMMKPSATSDQIKALCERSAQCKMVGHPSEGGIPFFELRGTELDLAEILSHADGLAEFVEPALTVDFQPEIEEAPEAATWGLSRIGSSRDARDAQGRGVHMYVFDTGVRPGHAEFGGRVVPSIDMTIARDPIICNGNLQCALDNIGHGTHCAGIASSSTYGVAPLATVYGVKVLGDYGVNPWDWTYGGVDWVIRNKQLPAVASMSLGAPMFVAALKATIDSLVNAGITAVVAAGNDGRDACRNSPAYVPSAITVGSTDSRDARSSFSNFGSCTDIWAPGSNIVSVWHTSDSATNTLSGTSMACPFVSGGAALLLEQNPGWSPAKLREHMMANTVENAISGLTWEDTNKLLYVAPEGPPPTPKPAPTPPPPTPAPTPAPVTCPDFATGPDRDGDCKCKSGRCWEGGSASCTCDATATKGYKCTSFFLPSCTNCECRR